MVATRHGGFVLATTVWLLAILMVLAAIFHGYVQTQVYQARALKERTHADLSIEATAASLRYVLATRRTTLAGLTVLPEHQVTTITSEGVADITPVGGEIKLDDTLYQGLGTARFQIQDQAGLLGLNSPGAETLFFELLRDRVGAQVAREMSAALADYIDENTQRRFNGAERLQYGATDLPGPTNWFLRTDRELADVLGWQERLAESGLDGLVAPIYANVLNVNTAPPELLSLLLELDDAEVAKLIAAREAHPFRSLDGVAEAAGVFANWEENRFRFYSSDQLRVTLSCEGCTFLRVEAIELTPDGFFGPWLTDFVYTRPHPREQRNDEQLAASVAGNLFEDTFSAAD